LAILALLGALVTVAGCGGGDSGKSGGSTSATTESRSAEEEGEEEATPEQALAEIATIRTLLDDAVAMYAAGDHSGAADAVGDIYLEHFEKVEGPLGDVDHDLMEETEEQLSTDLRKEMEDGAPQATIDERVAEIKAKLDDAEEALS